ncbi:putative Ring finger protein [Quillaja saponaria]|uniref:RING-type E3 ubiquitin transferase n=1 Tax=Quillaja saponaria TaxID=32244 RepID=A0AAD7PD96_QUISA|nr:putative Ring finger protein [Quillaja saponaria]
MSSPPPPLLNVVGSNTLPLPDSSIATTTATPHRSSSLKNLSPSILIIVIILSVTVIASVALCLLLRHLNRRCLRHLSSSSTTTTASTTTTPIFSSSRRIAPETTTTTSIIDSLPLFTFSSITRRSTSSNSGDCAICLSKFEQHDQLRLLPLCCHAFHAECIDTWLQSNLTCPLCRSSIFASESDIMKVFHSSSAGGDSFRLEIGNISGRGIVSDSGEARTRSRSYSIGSFEYFVDEESEVPFSHAHRRSVSDNKEEVLETQASQPTHEENLAGDVASGRSWLKDYVDRLSNSLSSRAMSFRSSGRFFTGSSCRSENTVTGEWDIEANRVGEDISELFRWLSGV